MENSKTLVTAVIRILTPLVRILLRNGFSYGSFAEIAKKTFVDVAMNDFTIEGRKQSISRVSVITGLNRKEVKRHVENKTKVDDVEYEERYNRAARVIAGWRREAAYRKGMGKSPALPVDGKGVTFVSIVKKYSGDIPARAVLDELVRIGAVAKTDDGRVRLMTDAYLHQTDENMKLNILGTDAGHLLSTIEFNLAAEPGETRFQRKVSYDNLPLEAIAPFRAMSKKKAQSLLEYLDEYLSKYDRDTNPAVEGTGRCTAGIGIYYFEESTDVVKDDEDL